MYVWKITQEGMGGTLYLKTLDDFEDGNGGAEDFETGTKLCMEVVEMDKEVYDNLPEFECFE